MTKVLIDENLSEQFAEGLNIMQEPLGEGVEVTSIAKEFGKGIKDEDWIPKWGRQKGLFITQDINIVKTRQQALLLTEYELGAFFLKVPKNWMYWDKVKIIVEKWKEIVVLIKKTKRPYAYLITPRKIEKMRLR